MGVGIAASRELGHAPLKRGCAARTILLLQIRPARRRVARLAQLRKHGDESDAKTFGRDHETDIGFRKRCEIVQEARRLLALGLTKRYPRLMSIVPTSVGVRATDVQSDAKAAYDKAMKMAEEQRAKAPWLSVAQLFARVMEQNPELASRAFRRSSVDTDYLER
jgi:hypothetical protein